jgi:hypothetical protein
VLERVTVTRYVTPLREGGSLPALVEADNLGTYVMKFRGAGQGPLALVAEIIAGELARRLGLRVPELVLADLDPQIAASEPDPEIQDLLRASEGLNLGVDFLPGAAGFDPLGWTADKTFASQVLWFDALIQNVDRTWRNPNLLVWHENIWLIDHGAALYFHHNPAASVNTGADPRKPFDARDHVLGARGRPGLEEAHATLAPRVTEGMLDEAVKLVPHKWFGDLDAAAYVSYLKRRAAVVPEVIRA